MKVEGFFQLYRNGQRDFRGINLQGTLLEDVFFEESIDLSGANLSGIRIEHSDLSNVNLCRATLHHSEIIEVNFSGTYLEEADFSEAYLLEVGMSFCNLRRANLTKIQGGDICLFGADLSDANLVNSELSGDMRRVNFSRANLSNTYFFYADLSLSNLFGANIEAIQIGAEVTLSEVILPDGSIHA